MTDDRIHEADAIFQIAADLPALERTAFLVDRCGADAELLELVKRLLQNHEGGMGEFLNPPEPRLLTRMDEDPVVPERIGSYDILRKVGEGGMATVFEARQHNPRRVVALKVVKGAILDHSLIRRFHFETKVLARLDHPGIARVYEGGETAEGIPYFAMELVTGLPLTRYAEERELDIAGRFRLMARICDAVHYAHESGIIHRDLKPANILVTDEAGAKPQPKVLDFGVARALRSDLQTLSMYTSTGQLVGTLAYMSPEQVTGNSEDLDARSDVYQLGVMLYEMLAHRRPHTVTNLSVPQAARVILEEEPPPLRNVDTRYRGDVEAIVGKALFKEKERRFESAAAMAEDIRRYLNHEPITARPASGLYRARKLLRRRKEAFAGLAAGLIVALAVAATILVQTRGPDSEGAASPRLTQLTAINRDVVLDEAALSPDGGTLACLRNDGLFLQDIGNEMSEISLPEGYRRYRGVRWHPTGPTLLSRLGGKGNRDWYFVTRDGEIEPALSEVVVEALGGAPLDLRISPDGKRWLFKTSDWRSLWVMEGEDESLIELLSVPETSWIHSPVWNPSGESIAYVRADLGSDAHVLWTIDLEGRAIALSEPDARLTQRFSVAGGPGALYWLPDDRLLVSRAMPKPNDTSSEIVALNIDPTSRLPIGDPEIVDGWIGFGVFSLSASATGERLTFVRRDCQADVWLVDLDADGRFVGEPERFTLDDRIDRLGVWSPDGERIFFQSRRFGRWEVLSKGLDDSTPTKFVAGHDLESFLVLAPGGNDLLMVPRTTGRLETADRLAVLRVPLSGGDPEPIAWLEPDERIQCGVAPDAPCVISRPTETGVTFLRLDENWLPEVELGHADIGNAPYKFAVAPDGCELALIVWDDGARILDLKSGEWRLLCRKRGLQVVTYSPDGVWLYVSHVSPYSIVRISREGEIESLWRTSRNWVSTPRLSPDGTRLALDKTEIDDDAWMIEEF